MGDIKKKLIDEIYSNYRKRFPTKVVKLRSIYQALQCDLAEFQNYSDENDGYRYLLLVVNIFSKMLYVEPIKSKTGIDVSHGFESILKRMEIIPRTLWVDQGKEWYNKKFKELLMKHRINMFSTFSINKAMMVERRIRDLRRHLFKAFSYQGHHRFVEILPQIVKHLNNSKCRTIQMAPIDVSLENEEKLIKRYKYLEKMAAKKIHNKGKFKLNEDVRISMSRGVFFKEFDIKPNWSIETFKIARVLKTVPIMYALKDESNEPISGLFYNEELKHTDFPGIRVISKIVREDKKNKKTLVRYLGSTKDEWIKNSDLIK